MNISRPAPTGHARPRCDDGTTAQAGAVSQSPASVSAGGPIGAGADPETAILLAGADARIVAERAAPLLHRVAFLRSYQQQTGDLSDIGRDSLADARRELYELLRDGPSPATVTP